VRYKGHGSHGTMVFKGTFGTRPVAVKRMLVEVSTGMWLGDMHCWCDGIGDWLQFWEVANQEVDLLSQSDHHGNVVRYYYKACVDVLARCVRDSCGGGADAQPGHGILQEHDTQFLYIALELCTASVVEVVAGDVACALTPVRNPHPPPARRLLLLDVLMRPATGCPALPMQAEMMKDVMAGISHLHSLNIVHRDIKPANVLLSTRVCTRCHDRSMAPPPIPSPYTLRHALR
jgi:serine/threonine-protein kinase/endoribonuclease IRE1